MSDTDYVCPEVFKVTVERRGFFEELVFDHVSVVAGRVGMCKEDVSGWCEEIINSIWGIYLFI